MLSNLQFAFKVKRIYASYVGENKYCFCMLCSHTERYVYYCTSVSITFCDKVKRKRRGIEATAQKHILHLWLHCLHYEDLDKRQNIKHTHTHTPNARPICSSSKWWNKPDECSLWVYTKYTTKENEAAGYNTLYNSTWLNTTYAFAKLKGRTWR